MFISEAYRSLLLNDIFSFHSSDHAWQVGGHVATQDGVETSQCTARSYSDLQKTTRREKWEEAHSHNTSTMGRQWDKFRLLIWKNWLLQRRHKMQSAVEVLAPVIFATLMVLVRSLVEPEMADEVNFDSFAASKFFTPSSFIK